MQGGLLLLWRQPGEIHTGQFGGVGRIFQEHLAGVLKCLNAGIDRLSQKGTNFADIGFHRMQSGMLLHDTSLRINHKSSGQSRDSSVCGDHLRGGHDDWIIDSPLLREFQNIGTGVIVLGNADNLQLIFVSALQCDHFGDFFTARWAPRGPEIYQYDFAVPIRPRYNRAGNIMVWQRRGWLRALYEANDGSFGVARRSGLRSGGGSCAAHHVGDASKRNRYDCCQ